jgi:hypothetical protein
VLSDSSVSGAGCAGGLCLVTALLVAQAVQGPCVTVNHELASMWKEAVVHYPGVCMEGLRMYTKMLSCCGVCRPGFEAETYETCLM